MNRRTLALSLLVVALVAAPVVPAVADEPAVVMVSSEAGLVAALSTNCVDGSIVKLTGSFGVSQSITTACRTLTLDIDGNFIFMSGTLAVGERAKLTLRSTRTDVGYLSITSEVERPAISLEPDSELHIESGTFNLKGNGWAGGIAGAGNPYTRSKLRISGGTVNATGGIRASGIGGHSFEYGSTGIAMTIEGGTVNAQGGGQAPGIGPAAGCRDYAGPWWWSSLEISGGVVNATGGSEGAGIGTGTYRMDYADDIASCKLKLTISGGTVNATGGAGGAGIGGGAGVSGLSIPSPRHANQEASLAGVVISGGTVTAKAGTGAAGIGGGQPDLPTEATAAGRVSISGSAVVTATADAGLPSVGTVYGDEYVGPRRGPELSLDSELRIGSGFIEVDSGIRVGAEGLLLGSPADPGAGRLIGTGTVENHGTIAVPFSRIGASVGISWNNFLLSYNLAGGTGTALPAFVFAPTLTAAGQVLPAAPVRAGHVFTGWAIDGQPFTADTPIPGGSAAVGPTPVSVAAQWITGEDFLLEALGSGCEPGSTLTVPIDVTIDVRAAVACSLTIDLNGHRVRTRGLDVAAGATLKISDSAGAGSLTAASPDLVPSIDAGDGSSALIIDATTYIGPGSLRPGEWQRVSITEHGRLLGSSVSPSGATLQGTGQIDNRGVIGILPSLMDPGIEILGNSFQLTYDAGEGTSTPTPTVAYAPTLASGYRELPVPVRGVDRFDGWMLGSTPFTATTPLTGSSTGTPVAVALHAAWTAGAASLGPDLTAESNATAAFTPELRDGAGAVVATDPEEWEFDAPDGVSVIRDAESGEMQVSSVRAGEHAVTGTYTVNGYAYSDSLVFKVTPGPVEKLHLTFTGTAKQGETITLAVATVDAAGNRIEDVSDRVTVRSSITSDVIAGNTVRFVHASPHIITATLVGAQFSGSIIVQVAPAAPVNPTPEPNPPDALPETGANVPVTEFMAFSLGAIMLGVCALVLRRRRRTAQR